MLNIKKLSHQRAASLSKLDNTGSSNSISSAKYTEFLMKEWVHFSFSQPFAVNSKLTSQYLLPYSTSTLNYSRNHPCNPH